MTAATVPAPAAEKGLPGESVLSLRNVRKEYPGTPSVVALQDVSLSIDRGELVAVIGPSGSGKSTLLSIMGTLERASSGDVHVAGHDVSTMSDTQLSALRAWEIGFVFQSFFLLNGMTARENVADGMLYTGRPSGERLEIADAMLREVGLAHRADHDPAKMSGGERQRVAIARAVAGGPSIVLADEPTGNLDSRTGGEIVEMLTALNDGGTTIAVITHDVGLGQALPRQILIRDGRVVHDVRGDRS